MNHLIKIISIAAVFSGAFLNAQTVIPLETAMERAFENNRNLRSGQLNVDYQTRMQGTYRAYDPLNISAEIGQINSAYVDNRISASQSFRLPSFYNSQKRLLNEELKNAQLGLEVQKWQIRRDISLIYNKLNYLDEKQKLVEKADSIYSKYFQRAELRLKAGESNILEKTTAENYRSQAEIQLQNIKYDREIALAQLNYLIGGKELYSNQNSEFYVMTAEETLTNEHLPVLRQLEQQKNIEAARLETEKAKLKPVFSVGVNSGTIRGTGANDKVYNGWHRFHSVVGGVAIPVFNNAQKAVIESQIVNQQIADNNFEIGRKNVINQWARVIGEYRKYRAEAEYYRTKGLKNADKILFTADLLMHEGEINYMEWSLLVNQALEIRNRYVESQKNMNDKIIEMNALQGK